MDARRRKLPFSIESIFSSSSASIDRFSTKISSACGCRSCGIVVEGDYQPVSTTAITTEGYVRDMKDPAAIKAKHESTFKHVGPALLIFSIASSVWVGSLLHGWSWFSYHPTAMIIAYIAMAGNSALIKKIGGKTNTEIHGYMMTAAAALSAFGWYVIYTNKDMNGKTHNKTWHAWSGVATAAGFLIQAPLSYFAYNPTNGFARTNKTLRTMHKYGGRFLTALAWFTCFLGWYKMNTDMTARVAFAFPLVVLAPFVLI